ncbi:MAG: exopolysaccharide biosynthesis polyprenyl glycosylphosphotransferase [Pseudomonadota bacterium]
MDYVHSVSVSDHEAALPKSRGQAFADALSRIRFQLFGGLFFAVVLPALIRGNFERFGDQLSSYEHSLIGTVCALLFGYLIFRKMTVLPGARAITNVVPAFLTSYAVVVAFFFLMRIDYSRYQFLVSFLFACVWFGAILFTMARFRRPVFCVLPGAQTSLLQRYRGVKWKILKSRKTMERFPHVPIVVDFRDPNLEPKWERAIAEEAIKGRRILSARQLAESLTGRVQIEYLSENTFGHLAPDSIYGPTKRYVDILSALVLLAMFWPVMLITAIAIRLESNGPAIFKQERMGFRGKTFTVYKFRSMRVQTEAERNLHSDKTQSDDDRITKIGRFIRKTRIDELPQIINILRGDMSWIGPRPETLRLSKWYEEEIPFYRYRHIVRPGISGWAQVKQGHVTEVDDIKLKLEYDMYYVKHFSIWLDLLIAVKTISVVFSGDGAK